MAALDYNYLAQDDTKSPQDYITGWQQVQKNALDIQNQQAQVEQGKALQQSIDPQTGQFDQVKYNQLLAANPRAARGALQAAQGGVTLDTNTYDLHNKRLTGAMGAMGQLIADNPDGVPADAMHAAIERQRAQGNLTDQEAQQEHAQVSGNPRANTQLILQGLGHGLTVQQQLDAAKPPVSVVNVGGQIVPVQRSGQGASSPTPSIGQGSGSVATTLTPGEYMGGGYHYQATQADVDAGRATRVGQDIFMPGPTVNQRTGVPVPPGLQTGGGGPGVVNSDGTPASPKSPPRLLNVPGSAPAPPAPPGGAAAAPATSGNVGFGAAIGGSTPAPAASPALPTPPVPPTLGPRSDLGGGVQVASVNALAPDVGTASPPSPAVAGDVNAILAGIRNRQGTPSTGTQTAFNTIATGPGTEEALGYKTSADKLAADNVAAANFQNTQFPYVQALKNYGEGTKTGPTSDFWNQVAGTIRTPLAKLGLNIGTLDDNTQRQDALGKWLANIQSGNPVSAKSDAELAQVLKGSASTHINETTGADMVKAGLALQRMNVAATREWNTNPALQRQFGTYLNYLGNYNATTDPRAFAIDTYNPDQISRLRAQLKSGSEADAQRFEASLALARRNGMISGAGSQAMP